MHTSKCGELKLQLLPGRRKTKIIMEQSAAGLHRVGRRLVKGARVESAPCNSRVFTLMMRLCAL